MTGKSAGIAAGITVLGSALQWPMLGTRETKLIPCNFIHDFGDSSQVRRHEKFGYPTVRLKV